jgi:hypothetical protein
MPGTSSTWPDLLSATSNPTCEAIRRIDDHDWGLDAYRRLPTTSGPFKLRSRFPDFLNATELPASSSDGGSWFAEMAALPCCLLTNRLVTTTFHDRVSAAPPSPDLRQAPLSRLVGNGLGRMATVNVKPATVRPVNVWNAKPCVDLQYSGSSPPDPNKPRRTLHVDLLRPSSQRTIKSADLKGCRAPLLCGRPEDDRRTCPLAAWRASSIHRPLGRVHHGSRQL